MVLFGFATGPTGAILTSWGGTVPQLLLRSTELPAAEEVADVVVAGGTPPDLSSELIVLSLMCKEKPHQLPEIKINH